MTYLDRAQALRAETAAHRRYLHQNAETGLRLPKACAYVSAQLAACGIKSAACGHGIMAQIGSGGRVLLLRADMDALPMKEESGESFACPCGAAHACGHDLHAAMLLTAAKMLKENEGRLRGTVRLMFQPAEETFEGAKDMIENGVLDGVSAALAFHAAPGRLPCGTYMYNASGTMMCAADCFAITVRGRGAHGAYPHHAVDPVHIAAHLTLALESLIAREADPQKTCVLTVGRLAAGAGANAIPDTALLEGTIRTGDTDSRALLIRRMRETAEGVAKTFGGEADIHMRPGVPPLVCDPQLTQEMTEYIKALSLPGAKGIHGVSACASEDFALIAERVPAAFIYLSAGYPDQRGDAPAHSPKVRFNEDVLPMGSAYLAHCAESWLCAHA
ncbi:MAG: M20 family metallopeptidase [Eubacteriales bacterium]|nr:M20 family metallopeptidase [Eubacteriales bacterium]